MKEPKRFFDNIMIWILMLTFTAGYSNIVALTVSTVPAVHMTGNLTNISFYFYEGNYRKVGIILSFLVLFFIGGIVSGYIFSNKELGNDKLYGIVFLFAGIMLIIVEFFLKDIFFLGGIAAFVSGLQNSLNLNYNGILIRTTHMTGYVTDLSRKIGRKIANKDIDNWKLKYLSLGIIFYFLGGVVSVLTTKLNIIQPFRELSLLYIINGVFYLSLIYKKEYLVVNLPETELEEEA